MRVRVDELDPVHLRLIQELAGAAAVRVELLVEKERVGFFE
ncbi:hypothetical protein [Microbacterium sp. MM2322]